MRRTNEKMAEALSVCDRRGRVEIYSQSKTFVMGKEERGEKHSGNKLYFLMS
jgi:hypothetical protein